MSDADRKMLELSASMIFTIESENAELRRLIQEVAIPLMLSSTEFAIGMPVVKGAVEQLQEAVKCQN